MDESTEGYKRPMWQWILFYVVIAAVVYGVVYYFAVASKNGPQNISTNQAVDQNVITTQGRVVVSLKDAATGGLNGATAILVTIDNIAVHSSANGWQTVSETTKQFDLLELKQSGSAALLADVNLEDGVYDQVRLNISKAEVTVAGKTSPAKLPSNSLHIVGNFTVTVGQTSSVIVDIIADKSLHLTGSGKFILAPVVKLQTTENVTVNIGYDDKVTFSGGRVETEKMVGMDASGKTEDNFELEGDLEVDKDDVLYLNGKVVVKSNNDFDEEKKDEPEDSEEQKKESEQGKDEEQDKELSAGILNFSAQNGSGLTGTATLKDEDGKTKVKLNLRGGVSSLLSSSEPAHIHRGSCSSLGAVLYSLNPVVDGESETVIYTTLADLKADLPIAINVHKSAAEIATSIACTDIRF